MKPGPSMLVAAASWAVVLLVLAGCGEAPGDRSAAASPASGRSLAAPQAMQMATAVQPAAASPTPVADADVVDWAVTALLPQGDIDLPDGRVERSYSVLLANGPVERGAVRLQLQAVPPGVELVRAELAVDDLPARARLSPAGVLLLRHASTLTLDAGALRWALLDAPAATAGVQGRLLAGAAAQPVVAALVAHQAAADPQPRTLLLAQLRPEATVAAANQALRRAGLRIVQMRAGNHGLLLRPLAGGDAAASRAQQQLAGQAAVFGAVWLQPPTPAGPVDAQPAVAAGKPTDCDS